jgi:hypothetical protein
MHFNRFDSVESAHQYIGLLCEQVQDTRVRLREDLDEAGIASSPRGSDALRLVEYKMSQLEQHLVASRRILGDLRALRRVLLGERAPVVAHRS